MPFILKVVVTALIVAVVSEIAKRYTLVAAILASLPIISILAMVWLYVDTGNQQKVVSLSYGVFWAVLPSLIFFVTLPLCIKAGLRFPWAMLLSCGVMFGAYSLYVYILKWFDIEF